MYIKSDGFSGYDHSGNQIRTRGDFLLLIQPHDGSGPLKAIVRKVALSQCGHWMMGSAKIGKKWYAVSGTYGSDGLPLTLPNDVYAKYGLLLPAPLYDAWNNGGGWNGVGSEAPLLREWALSNIVALSPSRKVGIPPNVSPEPPTEPSKPYFREFTP